MLDDIVLQQIRGLGGYRLVFITGGYQIDLGSEFKSGRDLVFKQPVGGYGGNTFLDIERYNRKGSQSLSDQSKYIFSLLVRGGIHIDKSVYIVDPCIDI